MSTQFRGAVGAERRRVSLRSSRRETPRHISRCSTRGRVTGRVHDKSHVRCCSTEPAASKYEGSHTPCDPRCNPKVLWTEPHSKLYCGGIGRGTQVVRERSAKPLYVSSILTRASILLPANQCIHHHVLPRGTRSRLARSRHRSPWKVLPAAVPSGRIRCAPGVSARMHR
jgi:hypothetical protein